MCSQSPMNNAPSIRSYTRLFQIVICKSVWGGNGRMARARAAANRRTRGKVLELERRTLHVAADRRRFAIVETKTVDASNAMTSPTPRFRYQLDNHLASTMMEVDEVCRVISYEEYFPYGST